MNFLFKVNYTDTWLMYWTYPKLTIKKLEQQQLRHSDIFVVKQIQAINLVFYCPLWTYNCLLNSTVSLHNLNKVLFFLRTALYASFWRTLKQSPRSNLKIGYSEIVLRNSRKHTCGSPLYNTKGLPHEYFRGNLLKISQNSPFPKRMGLSIQEYTKYNL